VTVSTGEVAAEGDVEPVRDNVDVTSIPEAEVATSAKAPKRAEPDLREALAAAVKAVGGDTREGQIAMAEAVARAMTSSEDARRAAEKSEDDDAPKAGTHLLVQAGTGTGKSLAYLVPAVLHALRTGDHVIVATATIALQRQLVERDVPLVADALAPLTRRRPTYAILKGRHHYLCQHRLNEGPQPDDDSDTLFAPAETTPLGKDVRRIREWADDTESGDRDELVPAPAERAWRALSVTSHECIGASRCQYGETCFAEKAREEAKRADVVVTNHAMLAIDAVSGIPLLPEHDVVIVDEGHELVDRVTGAITDELTASLVERAARRAKSHVDGKVFDLLVTAGTYLEDALVRIEPGRIERPDSALFDALVAVRDACHDVLSGFGKASPSTPTLDGEGQSADSDQAARVRAKALVEEVYEIAGRIVVASDSDVVWASRSERRGTVLWRAPLSVAGLLRESLFTERTAVLTSATLTLGGSFDPIAGALGLRGDGAPKWEGLDAGSPFDYAHQGILYVAGHLPPPGREGLPDEALEELASLVEAANGRTLGLFSSMRGAERAAEFLRGRITHPVLCQGDDSTAQLVRDFAADPQTCLVGTLSLWQGVDVPGASCSLVVIDRIPFPRPDDPLSSARARAIAQAGGNGFLAVSATSAALLLAQGAGRLIRSQTDRGVVAVLDPRLVTARYGEFLLRSLPPFWRTNDSAVAQAALRRLAAGE
jgi:ATP-dependent DNA helicase DinG